MALASISAAGINFILNLYFIPKYGYIAAAYTTLVSFLWLMLVHMFLVYRIGYAVVYDWKFNMIIVLFVGVYTGLVHLLYGFTVVRYLTIAVYCAVLICLCVKNKTMISRLLKRK